MNNRLLFYVIVHVFARTKTFQSALNHVVYSCGAGADLENFITVAHRAWLVSGCGKTKEFCD